MGFKQHIPRQVNETNRIAANARDTLPRRLNLYLPPFFKADVQTSHATPPLAPCANDADAKCKMCVNAERSLVPTPYTPCLLSQYGARGCFSLSPVIPQPNDPSLHVVHVRSSSQAR